MKYNTNLLTKQEKANELGITYRTLDKWISSGKITYFTIKDSKKKFFLPERVDQNI
jgi:predicted site-specific integrase-resolvase